MKLFEEHCREGNKNYFRDILLALFFEGLAKPKSARPKEANAILGDVPYLNGGLFMPNDFEEALLGAELELAGDIDVPNELFDPRLRKDDEHKEPSVLGLLSSYRFTTRESTPDDMSVDPDPELLGKVFENLNEVQERHDTGTYYTPREIVRFMCREALDGYLCDEAGVDRDLLGAIRAAGTDQESDEGGDIVRMGVGFGSSYEPSTDPDSGCSCHKRCGHGPTATDAAGRDHGYGDCGQDILEKRQQRNPTAHVATGLGALSDDQIAACSLCGYGLLLRADLPGGQGATRVDFFNQSRLRVAVEELDHPSPISSDSDTIAVEKRHQEVDAKSPFRPFTQFVEHLPKHRCWDHDAGNHAEGASVGDGRCERRRGDSAHASLLQWNRAASQLCESGREHAIFLARLPWRVRLDRQSYYSSNRVRLAVGCGSWSAAG